MDTDVLPWHWWSRFSSYDSTVDDETIDQLLSSNFVSHTVQAGYTHRDVVEQIAQHAQIPVLINSLSDQLNEHSLIRGRVTFEMLGKAIDDIALNYPGMQWWLTNEGLHMEIMKPLHQRLGERLKQEVGTQPAQARGYAFERFLNALFAASGLKPRASFRIIGEQIDGSFQLDESTYLLEAKWQDALVGSRELHAFNGVVKSKSSWTRGLFISYTGFSVDGLTAFQRSDVSLICLSGEELRYVLAYDLNLAVVLRLKARHAAETGQIFESIERLISNA